MQKYNYAVSLTRITAMLFIVICHCSSLLGHVALASLFDVGVPIFFVISGYLTASKKIADKRSWAQKKMVRLYIPLLLWFVVYTIVKLLKGNYDISLWQVIMLLLNMQGLNHICNRIPLGVGPWFFTVIELCYIFYLVLDTSKIVNHKDKYSFRTLLSLFGIVVVLQFCGINFGGIFTFYLGCFIYNNKEEVSKIANKIWIIIIFGTVSIALRLVGKMLFDDTVFYDNVLSSFTHTMLAASIFLFFQFLGIHYSKTIELIGMFPLVTWLDKISIYVYLTHTWFLGVLICNVFEITNFTFAIVILIAFTLSMSSFLYSIEKVIHKVTKL